MEGFETFLQPKSVANLMSACSFGYVVLVNVHHSRCDALILHSPRNVTHVPLPSFTFGRAEKLQKQLRDVLKARKRLPGGSRYQDESIEILADEEHHGRGGERLPDPNLTMRRILSELWDGVVKPVLEKIDEIVGHSNRHAHLSLTNTVTCTDSNRGC